MSPAVVTETLYALVTQQDFVPDEVHVITTTQGRARVLRDLLGVGEAGGAAAFEHFVQAYLPGRRPRFGIDCVHVLGQGNGDGDGDREGLSDIRSDDDNRRAADTVYRVLRALKDCPGTRLHASVAGGRKSMSFYMGHAFSLVAEPGDQLSHVLVDPPFEDRVPDFYFPTPVSQLLPLWQHGQVAGTVDAQLAQVRLAELSVLKLGGLLADLPAKARERFDLAVRIAQATMLPPQVRLVWSVQAERGHVDMLGERIDLSRQQFAVLLLHALVRSHETELPGGAGLIVEDLPAGLLEKIGGQSVRASSFKSVRSKIRALAQAQVGPAADWLLIEAVGERRREEERPQALRLPAHCLTLVGVPDAWWQSLRRVLLTQRSSVAD